MGTNALVGKLIGTDVRYIYVNFDGYPKHMIPTLNALVEQIDVVLDNGDASFLGEAFDAEEARILSLDDSNICLFYRRDRGESHEETMAEMMTEDQYRHNRGPRTSHRYLIVDGVVKQVK